MTKPLIQQLAERARFTNPAGISTSSLNAYELAVLLFELCAYLDEQASKGTPVSAKVTRETWEEAWESEFRQEAQRVRDGENGARDCMEWFKTGYLMAEARGAASKGTPVSAKVTRETWEEAWEETNAAGMPDMFAAGGIANAKWGFEAGWEARGAAAKPPAGKPNPEYGYAFPGRLPPGEDQPTPSEQLAKRILAGGLPMLADYVAEVTLRLDEMAADKPEPPKPAERPIKPQKGAQ